MTNAAMRYMFSRIVAILCVGTVLLMTQQASAANWRELFRHATAKLDQPEPDSTVLAEADELLEQAKEAAEAAGPEAVREAQPFLEYNRGILAVKKAELEQAKERFSSVYEEREPDLLHDARYNLGVLSLREAASEHRNASQGIDAFMGQLASDQPDIAARYEALQPPTYRGPVLEKMSESIAPADWTSEEAASDAVDKQLRRSLGLYDKSMDNLRITMLGRGEDSDARWNYEIALNGRDEAQRLLDEWRRLQEELREQQQQEQQEQDQQQQNGQEPQSEQQKQQSQQQNQEAGEQQRESDQQQANEGQQPEGPEQQRQRPDRQETEEPQEGDQQGTPPPPSDQPPTGSDQEEPPPPEEDMREGEEAGEREERIDPGPERGQGEQREDEKLDLDPDQRLDIEEAGIEEGEAAEAGGEQAAAEPSIYGMTPEDARVVLDALDDSQSRTGRRAFLRHLRRGPASDQEKSW